MFVHDLVEVVFARTPPTQVGRDVVLNLDDILLQHKPGLEESLHDPDGGVVLVRRSDVGPVLELLREFQAQLEVRVIQPAREDLDVLRSAVS